MKDLSTIREEINKIDEQIVALWKKRMEICLDVAKYKKENNLPILDENREKALLNRVGSLAGEDLDGYCRELYEKIMSISRDYQQDFFNQEDIK